jgi:hypothetical protein
MDQRNGEKTYLLNKIETEEYCEHLRKILKDLNTYIQQQSFTPDLLTSHTSVYRYQYAFGKHKWIDKAQYEYLKTTDKARLVSASPTQEWNFEKANLDMEKIKIISLDGVSFHIMYGSFLIGETSKTLDEKEIIGIVQSCIDTLVGEYSFSLQMNEEKDNTALSLDEYLFFKRFVTFTPQQNCISFHDVSKNSFMYEYDAIKRWEITPSGEEFFWDIFFVDGRTKRMIVTNNGIFSVTEEEQPWFQQDLFQER